MADNTTASDAASSSVTPYPQRHAIRGYLKGTKTAQDVLDYLRIIALHPVCKNMDSGKDTKCTCLHVLRPVQGVDPPVLLGLWRFLLQHFEQTRATKQTLVMQWIRASKTVPTESATKPFLLPVLDDGKLSLQDLNYRICRNSFQRLLDMGRKAFVTLQQCVENDTLPILHRKGNYGKRTVKGWGDMEGSLVEYFESLPTTAETTSGDVWLLPCGMSKRGVYKKWCLSRGWIIQSNNRRGDFVKKNAKPIDASQTPKDLCSFSKFCKFWSNEYPFIQTRDVPGDKNSHNRRKEEKQQGESEKEENELDEAHGFPQGCIVAPGPRHP